ncbi:DUF4825 domain-containing protein [Metabacillus malikii]|uniref:DUF4825 domain-containing protein n=1 Tax=Metabacillus malikii TaxID=1504265 RepID=A0ABT9ZHR7_9BACI|nr:DUF4825 domain-containing protein [Metabacillus malikii]MDQ0231093.1 hypothetical protein [Metabacillus malikii]
MQQTIKYFFILILGMLMLSGCDASANSTSTNLFQYKDSFVGDNSAVVNTIIHLQGEEYFRGVELSTKEKPYEIIIKYDWSESELNERHTVIHNASYLFTLIKNVDLISFHFEKNDGIDEFKIVKDDFQNWFGKNLEEVDNEDELKELIQEKLKDESDVDQLFN